MNIRIFITCAVILTSIAWGCKKTPIGYLDYANGKYLPNSMTIRATPDPVVDALRIRNNSPWVSTKITGVLGTEPMVYKITNVTSPNADAAEVAKFRQNLYILGQGRIHYPLNTGIKPGKYIVSIGIQNAGDYYGELIDAMTIVVE
ncbi:hypothetical protein [Pedobacter sp. MW01-1-1]|uniref:hypothetical protein n=1 Tax=Pedobacter sp. MW01-1-1 TaxID=3383027 RepID=UPI003FF066FD